MGSVWGGVIAVGSRWDHGGISRNGPKHLYGKKHGSWGRVYHLLRLNQIDARRGFLHIPVPAITEYKVARNRPIRRRPLFTQEFGERVGHDVLAFIMGAAARSVEVEHCGIIVGSLWDQCGVIAVGSRWDHGGIAVGSQ